MLSNTSGQTGWHWERNVSSCHIYGIEWCMDSLRECWITIYLVSCLGIVVWILIFSFVWLTQHLFWASLYNSSNSVAGFTFDIQNFVIKFEYLDKSLFYVEIRFIREYAYERTCWKRSPMERQLWTRSLRSHFIGMKLCEPSSSLCSGGFIPITKSLVYLLQIFNSVRFSHYAMSCWVLGIFRQIYFLFDDQMSTMGLPQIRD